MTKKELVFNTSKENLFKYLNELDYQKKWIIGLENIIYHDDKNFTMYLKEGKKINSYQGKTLQVIPNQLLEIYVKTNFFETNTIYKLNSISNNITQLTYTNQIKLFSPISKILWFIIGKPFTYIMLKKMFSKLKALTEQNY